MPHPREVLKGLEQSARRRFGQHFLWREDVVERIVRAARVQPGDAVLEVGPGLGILTTALVDAEAELTAVELDRDLAAYLRVTHPDLRLVEADATKVDWAEVCPGEGWKVVANLPYNVGTRLVVQLLEEPQRFTRLVVMLQREVVDRLVAGPGSKAYGALSVQVAARGLARLVFLVPPGAFHPPPKVQSAVVRVDLYPDPDFGGVTGPEFDRVVRGAFSQRRKTLLNSLGALFDRSAVEAALTSAGLGASVRAEQVDLDGFRALARALFPPG